MFEEHDVVILTGDVSEEGLREGDVGTIVSVLGGGAAFLVEFMTLDGHTVAVAELRAAQMRAVTNMDVDHARPIEAPA